MFILADRESAAFECHEVVAETSVKLIYVLVNKSINTNEQVDYLRENRCLQILTRGNSSVFSHFILIAGEHIIIYHWYTGWPVWQVYSGAEALIY